MSGSENMIPCYIGTAEEKEKFRIECFKQDMSMSGVTCYFFPAIIAAVKEMNDSKKRLRHYEPKIIMERKPPLVNTLNLGRPKAPVKAYNKKGKGV